MLCGILEVLRNRLPRRSVSATCGVWCRRGTRWSRVRDDYRDMRLLRRYDIIGTSHWGHRSQSRFIEDTDDKNKFGEELRKVWKKCAQETIWAVDRWSSWSWRFTAVRMTNIRHVYARIYGISHETGIRRGLQMGAASKFQKRPAAQFNQLKSH